MWSLSRAAFRCYTGLGTRGAVFRTKVGTLVVYCLCTVARFKSTVVEEINGEEEPDIEGKCDGMCCSLKGRKAQRQKRVFTAVAHSSK